MSVIYNSFVTTRLGMVNKMKKSTQIIGLPIISILDGNQLGNVKSLVINPEKGSVDFLTIAHEDFQVSVKAIPFKKVIGIGEYAVTIDSESAVIDLNEIPIANQLVNKKIKITNTKVLTRKGELLGEVGEYFIDEDTGHILGMELNIPDRLVGLSSDAVVTFGKDIIIVKEDASSTFLDSTDQLQGSDTSLEQDLLDIELKEPIQTTEIINPNQSQQPEDDQQLIELKEKQTELLHGKTVTTDIFDKNGKLLFSKGTVLTLEDIDKAHLEGFNVVVKLSMNVEA
jgi:uncharacterized protein YrrD